MAETKAHRRRRLTRERTRRYRERLRAARDGVDVAPEHAIRSASPALEALAPVAEGHVEAAPERSEVRPLGEGLAAWISRLRVVEGPLLGQPLRVLPWQEEVLRALVDASVREVAVSVGRGSGKTSLAAAVAAAALDGPLARGRGEVVIVAASREQASICYRHVVAYRADAIAARRHDWRVLEHRGLIEHRRLGTRCRVLSSDPRRAHGIAPSLAIADEGAQWGPSGERMISALRTSMGKVESSRLLAIGTAPAVEEHWFARMLRDPGPTQWARWHHADADADPLDPETWEQAIPSLAIMPELRRAVEDHARLAARDPGELVSFRALRLNMGVADATEPVLVDVDDWLRAEKDGADAERAGDMVWGLDLGTNASQSVIASYWPETGRLEAVGAFPKRPELPERGRKDGVGMLYVRQHARGELVLHGERAVSVHGLVREAVDRWGVPAALAADRWRVAELHDAMESVGITSDVSPRGQGFRDGAHDVRAFRRALAEGRIAPVESLLLRAGMAAARIARDPAGNAKLAKRTTTTRDDAAAAAVLAVALGTRSRARPTLRYAIA